MLFTSSQKLFSFSRYLNFCPDFLVIKKKRLDSKDKVKFKIYEVNLVNKQLKYTYSNISRSKSSQAMKFGQVIEYNKTDFFFKKHAENEAERLVPDLLLFFRKALYEVEASVLQLSFNIL